LYSDNKNTERKLRKSGMQFSRNRSWYLYLEPEKLPQSDYSDEANCISEEDKYQSSSNDSSDQNIESIDEHSNSDGRNSKYLKRHRASNKLKNKDRNKKKYDGPQPSQHGMNMNNIDKFGEMNPMFYQYPQLYDRRILGAPHFSGVASQSLPFSQFGNPWNPFEGMSMMNSMPNMIMDPSVMYNSKNTQKAVQSSKKQEDTYDTLRDYYKNSFFPFSNDLLKDLVNQIEIYIQILIQTLLTAKDVNQQYQLYVLLYDFTKKKESILNPLKLPKFEVPWINPDKELGNEDAEPLKIQPQVSFYQSPILEYAYKIVKMIGK
jgi:hypothetical protein